MITYKLLDKYNAIAHFCTSREGGASMGNYASFNLSTFTGDNPKHIENNKAALCKKIGISPTNLVIPFQTHGTEIREIDSQFFQLTPDNKSDYLNGVDALITNQKNVCIGITTADCVPLLFFDPKQKVIAAAHAGWRGTCNRIAEKTIDCFVNHYNSDPSDIIASIGPSISAAVYEVGNDVVESFRKNGFSTSTIFEIRNGSTYLNLWEANSQLLQSLGIPKGNIEIAGICTYTEHERFFSARRLGIKSGRMVSAIMIK